MNLAPPGAINLALGELSFPMPQALKDKATELLNNGNPAYTPNAGIPELRQAIADRYEAKPEEILVTNGVEEAVFIAVMSLLNPGDKLAIPDPDYPAYHAVGSIFQNQIVRLPFVNNFKTIAWDLWEAAFKQGIKAILLSAPSNPSGFCLDEPDASRFAELCNRYHVIVIVDEIYAQLYFDKPSVSLQGKVERLVRIGGLSKSHALSGWRLGWLIAPESITPSFVKARQYISTCSHWLSQCLAIYALTDDGMALSAGILAQLSSNRNHVLQRFNASLPKGIQMVHAPSATPYLLLKVEDDLQFANQLAGEGVITVPGSAFGTSTTGWIRINYGIPPQQLSSALDIIYRRDET